MNETKLLLVAPSWIGDMVMAQSLLRLLKSTQPALTIDVLAPTWSHPILAHMPEVSQAIPMPIGHGKLALLERYKIAKILAKNTYQQAIILPNSFKSALIPWLAKIPLRTGWRGEMRYGLINDIRILDKQRTPLMVERYLALGVKKDETMTWQDYRPTFQVKPDEVAASLTRYHLKADCPIVILCPGAQYGSSKCWPTKHYATVATECIKKGWQVGLMGGKGEALIAADINEKTNNQCVDLTMTTLSEAVDLISSARSVVSNDSGLMHIAAALHRPLIALFGSSSPDFTPPLSFNAETLSLDLPCKPCFKRECPLQHHRCMEDISPKMVLTKILAHENITH
jgi:heptosyltransferase-2